MSSFERTSAAAMTPDFALMAEVDDADAARTSSTWPPRGAPRAAARSAATAGSTTGVDDEGIAIGLIDDILAVGPEDAFKVAVDAARRRVAGREPGVHERTEALATTTCSRPLYLEPAPRSRPRSPPRT